MNFQNNNINDSENPTNRENITERLSMRHSNNAFLYNQFNINNDFSRSSYQLKKEKPLVRNYFSNPTMLQFPIKYNNKNKPTQDNQIKTMNNLAKNTSADINERLKGFTPLSSGSYYPINKNIPFFDNKPINTRI